MCSNGYKLIQAYKHKITHTVLQIVTNLSKLVNATDRNSNQIIDLFVKNFLHLIQPFLVHMSCHQQISNVYSSFFFSFFSASLYFSAFSINNWSVFFSSCSSSLCLSTMPLTWTYISKCICICFDTWISLIALPKYICNYFIFSSSSFFIFSL